MLKPITILLTAFLFMLSFNAHPVQTQPVIPLPARDSIELLTNGDFEADSDNDKIPDGWTGKNTSLTKSDKLKCNKPDDVIAHSGACAFMFRGNPGGTASKLTQTFSDVSGLVDGSTVQFSAFIDPRSGIPGTTFGKAKIILSDDSKITFQLVIPVATALSTQGAVEDYIQIMDSTVLNLGSSAVTKVKVQFSISQTDGKFLIDSASLIVSNLDPTSTIIATVSSEATQTATPTATQAVNTPTSTPTSFVFDCNQLIVTWSNDAFHENYNFIYLINRSDKEAELRRVQITWQDIADPYANMYLGHMTMYDEVNWSGELSDNDNSIPGQTSVDTGIMTEGNRILTANGDALWLAEFFDGPAELGEYMEVEDFSAYFTFDVPGAFEDCVIELQNIYPNGTPTTTPIPHSN